MIYLTFRQKVAFAKKKHNWTSPDLVDEAGTTFFGVFFFASLLISYKGKWNKIKKYYWLIFSFDFLAKIFEDLLFSC